MLTRRDFIRNAAAAIALPVYIPIDRLDKIYIPSKEVIKPGANRLLTPEAIAREALDAFKLHAGDVFTIAGVDRVDGEGPQLFTAGDLWQEQMVKELQINPLSSLKVKKLPISSSTIKIRRPYPFTLSL